MRIRYFVLFAMFFMVFSCKSTKGILSNSVFIMIYDYNNSPVSNVEVFLDDDRIGKSDVNGRFVFDINDREEHKIRLEKKDHEAISDLFVYEDSLLLYYKMGSSNQYLNMAEDCIDKKSYEEALAKVTKSLQINPTREDSMFLEAIIYSFLGEYEKSNLVLDKLGKDVNYKYVEELRKKNGQIQEKKD